MKFLANRVSGTEGCIFALSLIQEVVKTCNQRNKYYYTFYATDINTITNQCGEWIREDENKSIAQQIMSDAKLDNLNYFKKLEKTVKKEALEFKKYSINLLGQLSPTISDKKLIQSYNRFIKKYIYYYGPGIITFLYESIISDWLYLSLSKKYGNATEIISKLLQSDYQSFLMVSEKLLKEKQIKKYLKDFFFMGTTYFDAPILDEAQVLEKAKELDEHKIKTESVQNLKFKLDEEEVIIAKLLKISAVIRDLRKYTNLIGGYTIFRFLDEAVRRKKINRNLAKRMFWFEFEKLFLNPKEMLQTLHKRKFVSIVFSHGKVNYFEKKVLQDKTKFSFKGILKGTPASKGTISGIVKIVMAQKDFPGFKKGQILVAEMTRPDYLPVMRKAAAIITDEGGLTCHAAIVARELGIPCIVGTRIATRSLKNGDKINLDAEKGTIRVIS
ncbi:MAG: hypothetical protein G01um10147_351 [Microgenomates group bacterium Gr01-1014_7]|nr:MAG: hypothetical protein G01um10147_351 [Microgenomates group bacterium Gr01-1014_7]